MIRLLLAYLCGALSMYAGMVILAVLRPVEERPLEEAALFV